MTWLNTRRLPVRLAAATLIPAVVLVWLGVRMLQQDRELDRQRQRERLEVAAGRVALEIDRRLQDFEAELVAVRGIRLHEGGIEPAADSPIVFQPADGPLPQSSPAEIAAIEVEEFQRRNLTHSETAYRRLSASSQVDIRAAALVGLGRVLRAQHQYLVVQWGGPPPPVAEVARSEAAGDLWRMWRRGDLGVRGRRLVQQGSARMLALWAAGTGQATVRFVADTEMLTAWRPLAVRQ